MAEKTAQILCTSCYQRFNVSANQIKMEWFFNGGCPYTELSVNCPKCGLIHPRMNSELEELLKDRIEAEDYDNNGCHTIMASSPEALKKFGLI